LLCVMQESVQLPLEQGIFSQRLSEHCILHVSVKITD